MTTRDFEAERAMARIQIAAAEDVMKRAAAEDDASGFDEAKLVKQRALNALERIDWAEKAALEAAEHAALDKKVTDLQRRQQEAAEAHARARSLALKVADIVDEFAALVKDLQKQKQIVDVGVHFEMFGVKDGLIERPTIPPVLDIGEAEVAVRGLRAARELARLSPISLQIAEQRAAQGGL